MKQRRLDHEHAWHSSECRKLFGIGSLCSLGVGSPHQGLFLGPRACVHGPAVFDGLTRHVDVTAIAATSKSVGRTVASTTVNATMVSLFKSFGGLVDPQVDQSCADLDPVLRIDGPRRHGHWYAMDAMDAMDADRSLFVRLPQLRKRRAGALPHPVQQRMDRKTKAGGGRSRPIFASGTSWRPSHFRQAQCCHVLHSLRLGGSRHIKSANGADFIVPRVVLSSGSEAAY